MLDTPMRPAQAPSVEATPPYDGRVGTDARHSGWSPALEEGLGRGMMLLPAGANVVMQLARRPVGRGVALSPESKGSLMRHPLRRTRTTLTYIAVALWGSDDQRSRLRQAVDAQHRHVRSSPGDEVAYDAVDPALQLWVAACMFVGARQGYETLYGELGRAEGEALLARCARFATTLQVPLEEWPQELAAFEEYWRGALARVTFDDVTRQYLRGVVELRFWPAAVARPLAPWHRVVVGGYLEPVFRDGLGLTWSEADQRRFERIKALARWWNRWAPRLLSRFPWNLLRHDIARRESRGRELL